jgi:hypothetical protein
MRQERSARWGGRPSEAKKARNKFPMGETGGTRQIKTPTTQIRIFRVWREVVDGRSSEP